MKHIYNSLTIFLFFWSMAGVFAGFGSGFDDSGKLSVSSGWYEFFQTPVTRIGHQNSCRDQEIMVPVMVTDFSDVGAFRLMLKYDTARLHLINIVNTSDFPDFHFYDYPGEYLRVTGRSESGGISLQNNSTLFTLVFQYSRGNTSLFWFPWDDSCHYELFPDFSPISQVPPEAYYHDGSIAEIPDAPVSVTISADKTQICQNDTVTFTASPLNGGQNPQFQWFVNGILIQAAIGQSLVYLPSDNDRVSCSLLSDRMCATGNPAISNEVSIHAEPLIPVAVSIVSSADTICAGHSITFSALPVNGGDEPVFQWFVNDLPIPGNAAALYTYTPEPGDQIRCSLTSSIECISGNPAMSATLAPTILPLSEASVTVTASAEEICTGDTVIYIASVVSGGLAPVFSWLLNGEEIPGETEPILTITHQHSDTVQCRVHSTDRCPSVNPVFSSPFVVRVNPLRPVSVSIRPSSNPVCEGSKMAVKATVNNGGNNPVYAWRINGFPFGGNTSQILFTPSNNDIVSCTVLSNITCAAGNPATSEPLRVLVQAQAPLNVKIEASALKVCEGTTVTYTAYALNGGLNAVYQWNVNGRRVGSNAPVYSYIPGNGDIISCKVFTSEPCVTGSPASSHPLTMQVSPKTPISVTITPSDTTICQGTVLQFTANSFTGSYTPAYQWQINSQSVPGATNHTFETIPSDGDSVRCMVSVQSACASNNPAYSDASIIRVDPWLPVSVSVSPDANPVCQGSPVTLTAVVVNAGNNPQFEWKLNGQVTGTNTPQVIIEPSNFDSITCTLTSNVKCPLGNPSVSDPLIMMVTPLAQVSIDVIADTTVLCDGEQVTFHAVCLNAGDNPVYQWMVNGQVTGENQPVFSYIPENDDSVSCRLISNQACAVGNPAQSNTIAITVQPILTVGVSVTATDSAVCNGSPVTFHAFPVNEGTQPTYQWFLDSSIIPGATNSQFTDIPQNGREYTCLLTSSSRCVANNPVLSNPKTIHVDPVLPVNVSVLPGANPVCQGSPVTLRAKAVNAGTAPTYVWRRNGAPTGGNSVHLTLIPSNDDTISCTLTSSVTCPESNPVVSEPLVMKVTPPAMVSIKVIASATTVCEGAVVTYNSLITNGGTNPVFKWKVNGQNAGGNQSVFSYFPANNDSVSCRVISNQSCAAGNPANSNTIRMTVNPVLIAAVTVLASDSAVCEGTPVALTANAMNGGTSPGYQWFLNGASISGATNAQFTGIPHTDGQYTCQLTSSAPCVSNNPVTSIQKTVIVDPLLPVSVTVTSDLTEVCSGTSVSLTAVVVNGGTNPLFVWKVNGQIVKSSAENVFSFTPGNNDAVWCEVFSTARCSFPQPAISDSLTFTVHPLRPVSVSLVAPSGTICEGNAVSMSAVVVNGGNTPDYQWLLNGNVVQSGLDSTYTFNPVSGDLVQCVLTSSINCPVGNPAASQIIPLTVHPQLPVSVAVFSSSTEICAGTQVTFTAYPVNGGVSPQFQWMINGIDIEGATNSVYSVIPVDQDSFTCRLYSGINCPLGNPAVSNSLTINVMPILPVSVSVTTPANSVCAGQALNFSADIVNGGNSPSFQWQVNGNSVSGATNATYTYGPANGDSVSCIAVSSAQCTSGNPAGSSPVEIEVYPFLPLSVTILSSAITVCSGTAVTFTATAINAGDNPVYQWLKNGVVIPDSTNASLTIVPSNNDLIRCKVTSGYPCSTGNPATSNQIKMKVNPSFPVSITISTPQTSICEGSNATFTAVAVNGGVFPGYQWRVNGNLVSGAITSSYTYQPANLDTVTCTLNSTITCTTGNPATSNAIIMATNALVPVNVTISASAYAVMPGTSVTFTAAPFNGGYNPAYQWKVNNNNVGTNSPTLTYVPSNNDAVKCVMTSAMSGCLSNNPVTSEPKYIVVYSTGTPCTGIPTVTHQGKVYNTVQVGTQCWLRESINHGTMVDVTVTQTNNSVVEKYCQANDAFNCQIYGGLYQWAEAVQYLNGVTNTTHWNPLPTTPVQGICPPGWHIPTNAEATTMINFLGGSNQAGGKMKSTGINHWNSPNTGATNQYGLTAYPGGSCLNGNFMNLASYGSFWTTTKGALAVDAYFFGAAYNFAIVQTGQAYKISGLSVRCLKN